MENKLSDAQKRAQKKYDEENKEKRNYLKSRSAARSFIRNKAKKEDLDELKEIIEEKYKSM